MAEDDYNRRYYSEHADELRAKARERMAAQRRENPEAVRERKRIRYAEMTEEQRQKQREASARYRAKHPGKSAEYSRRYRETNPEAAAEAQRRYVERHPGIRVEISKRFRQRHLEEERRRIRESNRKYYKTDTWYYRYLARYYGPGADVHYAERFKQQDGKCAICGAVPKKERLHLDHNHSTRQLRGLLCGDCNRVLGLCREDIERILRLADYIKEWGIKAAA